MRPWQTLVLFDNMVSLPIIFYRAHGQIVWGFLAINFLLILSLVASTWILIYFGDKLPPGQGLAVGQTLHSLENQPSKGKDESAGAQ